MKIGLIGEDPNDTAAIANLLKLKFDHQFVPVIKKRAKGDQLENSKFTKLLKAQLIADNYDLLIFIRDLDGFDNEDLKVKARMDWFSRNSKHFEGHSLFLINIQELEAIFFADVENLNKIFNLGVKFKNPLSVSKPKETLKRLTNEKYHENKAADYISKLTYDTVLKNYKPLKEIDGYLKV